MKRNVLLFTICLSFVSYACQPDKKKVDNSGKVKKITVLPDQVSKFCLEKETEKFFFIPLETKSESLIKYIDKLYLTDNEIIAVNKPQKTIFIFDKATGALKHTIFHGGKGPQEYTTITDVLFDEQQKNFEILDRSSKKLVIYNFKGDFLKSCRIENINESGLGFYKTTHYYFFDRAIASFGKIDGNRIAVYDAENFKFPKSFFPFPKSMKKFNFLYSHTMDLYSDTLYFLPLFDNKIYRLSSEGLLPEYEIDFPGKVEINTDEMEEIDDAGSLEYYMSKKNQLSGYSNLFITDEFVAFSYKSKDAILYDHVLCSKTTGKVKQYNEILTEDNKKFRCLSKIIAKDKDYFVAVIDPTLYKYLPSSISKNLDNESNPVLLFFKLKKF